MARGCSRAATRRARFVLALTAILALFPSGGATASLAAGPVAADAAWRPPPGCTFGLGDQVCLLAWDTSDTAWPGDDRVYEQRTVEHVRVVAAVPGAPPSSLTVRPGSGARLAHPGGAATDAAWAHAAGAVDALPAEGLALGTEENARGARAYTLEERGHAWLLWTWDGRYWLGGSPFEGSLGPGHAATPPGPEGEGTDAKGGRTANYLHCEDATDPHDLWKSACPAIQGGHAAFVVGMGPAMYLLPEFFVSYELKELRAELSPAAAPSPWERAPTVVGRVGAHPTGGARAQGDGPSLAPAATSDEGPSPALGGSPGAGEETAAGAARGALPSPADLAAPVGALLPLLVAGAGASLAALALYTRIAAHRALEQGTRRRIYDAVAAQPGIRVGTLKRQLGLSYPAVERHVNLLVRLHLLEAHGGGQRRLFVPGAVAPGGRAAVLAASAPATRRVLAHLRGQGPIALRDLRAALALPRSTATIAVQRLRAAGLVATYQAGDRLTVALVEGAPPEVAPTGAPAIPPIAAGRAGA